ncbi:MAG: hypothetical protein ACREC6_00565 [Hyphomicrobiaceae bacterium]
MIPKAPGLFTFLVAFVLGLAAVVAHLGVPVPVIRDAEFWTLALAYLLLMLGCTMRGL